MGNLAAPGIQKLVEKAGWKMERMTFEEMRAEVFRIYGNQIEGLSNPESVYSDPDDCLAMLRLARALGLITGKESDEMVIKALRVFQDAHSLRAVLAEEEPAAGEELLEESRMPFDEVPEEEQEPFQNSEEENRMLEPDAAAAFVEKQYEDAMACCSRPNGCDEYHLNYLHGYFTLAGGPGVISMHWADDMVYELTHIFDYRNDDAYKELEENFAKARAEGRAE